MKQFFIHISLIISSFISLNVNAQDIELLDNNRGITRILFLLDGSGSMNDRWGDKTKMKIAAQLLSGIADSLNDKPDIEMALRVYGHTSPRTMQDCKDTKLEVLFAKQNARFIKGTLSRVSPKGITPIAYSLEQAAYDFPDTDGRNVVILITDGLESCQGDPCAISLALQQKNVFLKPFVIGLGLDPKAIEDLKCIGDYYNATNVESFQSVMKSVVNRIVNRTQVKVHLQDKQRKPTETNAVMSFYDEFTGQHRANYYHTMDARGVPDTIPLDPIHQYKMTVHTLPPKEKTGIRLIPNKKNVVKLYAPQGYLEFKLDGTSFNAKTDNKIKCIVQPKGKRETINIQDLDITEKYICGTYDLEILTLPRIRMKDVVISQSKTTTIEIGTPGILNINKNTDGYGAIFEIVGDELVKIYTLNTNSRREILALQAGRYTIIYRPKFSKETDHTKTKTFEIKSGGSASVIL